MKYKNTNEFIRYYGFRALISLAGVITVLVACGKQQSNKETIVVSKQVLRTEDVKRVFNWDGIAHSKIIPKWDDLAEWFPSQVEVTPTLRKTTTGLALKLDWQWRRQEDKTYRPVFVLFRDDYPDCENSRHLFDYIESPSKTKEERPFTAIKQVDVKNLNSEYNFEISVKKGELYCYYLLAYTRADVPADEWDKHNFIDGDVYFKRVVLDLTQIK